LFIHCAQSETEVAAVRARGYRGSVQCLAANHALGPNSVLAHCVYVADDEIAMLADAGAWVAHCPVSNARIEGRMAPVARMRAAGARMTLATDWAPTNNGMDLFDDMKCAGLLNKVAADSPEFLTAGDLLAMTTVDAARALGLGEVVGSLEPGKRADVVAVDMDGLHLLPWQDVEMTLVYSVKGLDVRHVWVDGEPVVRDRRPLRVNPDDVREQVARIWFRYRYGRP
jgi:5-methylthioadenosine/S-adenosylhomocysteine deaminase